MQFIGKSFISIGIILTIIGIIFYFSNKIPFKIGQLPGDILIKKDGFTFYFPLTTTILISIIFNIIIAIIKRIL
ncbi:DUF2905 domain-containing protein [Marinitoga sp. 38H-ov]|uniref:DUF2905 domain-containing protein n=1 Tax=Marinitoga sp. 38H-ov TaxID=1755814 RepID=UPI0013ED1036|nr:DUF2905 domain-containing protein [Marinitoga sp. 38H-ov]KAF2956443.1 hypothetical protein AS160_05965 [Marinitoga sp. 38H-ov]